MKEKESNVKVWEAVINGIKTGRFYKVDAAAQKVFYSDDLNAWKKSNMKIECFYSMDKEQV